MNPTSVLILHGWQNHRPAGHWQHVLADELLPRHGVDVRLPGSFPTRTIPIRRTG